MTSKAFVAWSLGLTAALLAGFVAFNVHMDEFGLYSDARGDHRRIWTYNRASKYLLSLNHIPANFDGLLIGSSSAVVAMDTRKIKTGKIYNLAMNGANICEIAPAAKAAMKRGQMKRLIVCLDPYLTKNSMMKTNELSPKLEQSVLGSLFTIKFSLYKIKHSLFPRSDPYRDSWAGYRLPDAPVEADDADGGFTHRAIVIDPAAVICLKDVLETARLRGVPIYAYFYPKPRDVYAAIADEYAGYRKHMVTLFTPEDTVWDFNTPHFDFITGDRTSYYDRGHLSLAGAKKVLREIEKRIDQKSK